MTGINCVWNITVEASSTIALNFTVFDLDSVPVDNQCDMRYAHVSVVDGRRSAEIHLFCGQDLPEVFVSSSNTLIVGFLSHYGHSGGFHAHYTALNIDDEHFRQFSSVLRTI